MSDHIIETRELSRHFRGSGQAFGKPSELKAVDGVNLAISEGETLGLVGESGCGKSTVGKLLTRLLEPSGGEVLFRGQNIASMGKAEMKAFRREAQIIFQDPYSSLNPRMRIGDIIGEPLIIQGAVRRPAYRERVTSIMERVGLSADHFHRYPHQFSGGQRQRIGIARALAASPRLIVADEPVSALDLSIQAQILNLLNDLRRELSLSYLFISHDLSVVRHMCERVAIMYLGRIVETGGRDALFNHCLHPYTEALLSAVPSLEPGGKKRIILKGDLPSPFAPPPGCPFHTRCPYAEPICATVPPPLEEKRPGQMAACHFSLKLFS